MPNFHDRQSDIAAAQLSRNHLLMRVGIVGVLLLGAWLRFYRLGAQELWLDELYIADLVRGGLGAIWRTAFVDILAPLSILPFWLAGQIWGISVLSLRTVSTVASLLSLAAFYRYCTLVVAPKIALVTTGLFAIAPLAIYYAQEARPYALGLMGAILTLWAYERVRRHGGIGEWVLYAILASIAGQLFYLNVFLVGAQLLALLVLASNRRRVLLGGLLTVLATVATLGPYVVNTTGAIIGGWKSGVNALDFTSTMQTLMSGDSRFAPAGARLAALTAVAVGFAVALAARRAWQTLLPHVFQISMVLLVSFLLLPLIGKPVPSADERIFLMILPSVLIGFGIGTQQLFTQGIGRLIAVILVMTLSLASLASLRNYFNHFIKSPEGRLVGAIAAHASPGDPVITQSDAYSVDAALRFYRSDLPVYRYHRQDGDRWFIIPNPSILIIYRNVYVEIDLSEMMQRDRLWLVERESHPPYLDFLLTQYEVREEYAVAPFRALLLEHR